MGIFLRVQEMVIKPLGLVEGGGAKDRCTGFIAVGDYTKGWKDCVWAQYV